MSSVQCDANAATAAAGAAVQDAAVRDSSQTRNSRIPDVLDEACGQAAIDALRAQALAQLDSTRDVLRDRIQTVMAGKMILDNGGVTAVRALEAKQASIDVARKDMECFTLASRTLALLEDATAQLQQTQSEQERELGAMFVERVGSYHKVIDMLKEQPSSMFLSASENDALALAHAKTHLADSVGSSIHLVRSKTAESADAIHTKLASIDQTGLVSPLLQIHGTSIADSVAKLQALPDVASVHFQEGCKRLQDKVQGQLHASLHVVSARVDTALAGRQLLSLGGDSAVQALSARKASINAANSDAHAVLKMQDMSAEYKACAAKLMLAAAHPCGDFALLAEQYVERAHLYEQIATILESPVSAPAFSAAEEDACLILEAKAIASRAATQVTDGAGAGLKSGTAKAAGSAAVMQSWVASNSCVDPRMERCPCA